MTWFITHAVPWLLIGAIGALTIRNVIDAYRAAPPPTPTPEAEPPTPEAEPKLPIALLVVRADRDARADISRAIERDERTRWN